MLGYTTEITPDIFPHQQIVVCPTDTAQRTWHLRYRELRMITVGEKGSLFLLTALKITMSYIFWSFHSGRVQRNFLGRITASRYVFIRSKIAEINSSVIREMRSDNVLNYRCLCSHTGGSGISVHSQISSPWWRRRSWSPKCWIL